MPLGRRIAFEPAAGRMWLVCGHCGQWCLVPIEARWEAIEECESMFKTAAVRVSSDNVGLAEIDRMSFVRIGTALRDELANWRYGSRIRRRRRRVTLAYSAGVAGLASAFGAAALVAGQPMVVGWLGLVFVAYAAKLRQIPNWQRLGAVRTKQGRIPLRRWDLPRIAFSSTNPRDISIVVASESDRVVLTGIGAISFLSEILPRVNWDGGSESEIRSAVREVDAAEEATGGATRADQQQAWEHIVTGPKRRLWPLSDFVPVRLLAIEMAITEEMERRMLNRDALAMAHMAERESEIASIADDMFIREPISRLLGVLQRRTGRSPSS